MIQKPTITKSETLKAKQKTEQTDWPSLNPSPQEWDIRDAWTLGLIIYNCKNPIGLGINMDGTAAEAWDALTKAYGVVSDLATMGAENRLRSTRFVDGADFLNHISDLRMKWKDATEKGATINDATFRSIVMASLPESWNAVVASMYATKTLVNFIAGLTVHWE